MVKVRHPTASTWNLRWVRTDVPGSEIVAIDTRAGLWATGSQHAIDPVPYSLNYELWVDEVGRTTRLLARAEGATWSRTIDLERADDGWMCQANAEGNPNLAANDGVRTREPAPPGVVDAGPLRAAVDVDIGGSPFTNSLPVRRLGLLEAEPGLEVELVSAWVLPPTLEVVASPQTYTVVGDRRIRYGDAATGAEVHYDPGGWVDEYPGLARRAAVPRSGILSRL